MSNPPPYDPSKGNHGSNGGQHAAAPYVNLQDSYEQFLRSVPEGLPVGIALGGDRTSFLHAPPAHMGISREVDPFLFTFMDTEFSGEGLSDPSVESAPVMVNRFTSTTAPAESAVKRRRLKMPQEEDEEDDDDEDGEGESAASIRGSSAQKHPGSVTQASMERRRFLNRNNAKKSRMRKKWKIEAVVLYAAELQEENRTLRAALSSAGLEVPLRHQALAEAAARRGGRHNGEGSGSSDEDSLKGIVADAASPKDWDFLSFVQLSRANFLLADPRKPDCPIVYVNSGFLSMSGYTKDEVMGRNCRFLQGPDTDRQKVAEIAKAIKNGTHCSETILNYRKDGTPFWNQLFVAPLGGSTEGDVSYFIGIQREVSVKKTPVT